MPWTHLATYRTVTVSPRYHVDLFPLSVALRRYVDRQGECADISSIPKFSRDMLLRSRRSSIASFIHGTWKPVQGEKILGVHARMLVLPYALPFDPRRFIIAAMFFKQQIAVSRSSR